VTNEQLADYIKQGGSDELLPLLWERCRKLLYMRSDKYYSRFKSLCDNSGVTSLDIKQACYSAFLKAIEGYKPERDTPFISYLKYPFKNVIRELIGGKNPLNDSISLNAPVGEEDETELLDLLPDNSNPYEQAEQADINRVLHEAVNTLADNHRQVIQQRYYDNRTLKDIAEEKGVTPERIRQLESKALRELRKNSDIKALANELGYNSQRLYSNTLSSYKRTGQTNVEAVAITRADMDRDFIKMLLEYKKCLQAVRAAGETEQAMQDNRITPKFYNILVKAYSQYGLAL